MFPRNEDFNNASRFLTKYFSNSFSICFSYILKFKRLFFDRNSANCEHCGPLLSRNK